MKINMPNNYIQERGAINKIATYFQQIMKDNVLILMDEFSYTNIQDKVTEGFKEYNVNYIVEIFKGECCMENINAIIKKSNSNNIKWIIGIGGGKVLDVAKAVGHYGDMKYIMVPTAASTDGPGSKISVLYESDGTFKEYINLHNNPYGIIVDTEIIANAPVRLLKAGIGDALSTYFETEAGYEGDIERHGFSDISLTARVLSRECFEAIINNAYLAIQAVENKEVNEALEKVIEAIIYLSCIGFENGSLAAAHSIANALTSTSKYNRFMHGEKVAFGTIVQLLLENKEWDLVNKVRNICRDINLPYKAKQIGIESEEELEYIVEMASSYDQPIHNMKKVFIDKESIKLSIKFTEKL
ncbi:glycerol dehydrogenase [Clostridium sp. D53t1_180928_C8]|uniref:glycerol dehydrogenase n=1 Tax=Clostridium sp. D53t1_180928_C8 TaxID=2787101 RepID=UPI0018A98C72|nr:glycerol dehydrogenase [Clostridium sp. D53t1_180928_C8]